MPSGTGFANMASLCRPDIRTQRPAPTITTALPGRTGGLGDTNVWFVTLPDTVPVADLLPPGVGSAKRPTGTDGEPREWATTRHETETNRADPPAPSTHHDVAAIVEDGSTDPAGSLRRDFLTQHRVGQPESADPATAPVLAARGWLRSNGAVVRAALVGHAGRGRPGHGGSVGSFC